MYTRPFYILADRTATQYDLLLASYRPSLRPSVCNAVRFYDSHESVQG